MGKELSRRKFIKGAAFGATGVAAASFLGACSTGASGNGSSAGGGSSVTWDEEYDVVVLGYGAAGSNAFVSAIENGASKVLLAEKAVEGREGGNSSASGQFVMATDNPDELYNYLTAIMGKFNNWDPDAMRTYCDGCAENFDWMTGPMGGNPELIAPRERPTMGMEAAMTKPGNIWLERENPWNLGRSGWVYNWHEFPELESGQHCLCLSASGTRFDRSYYNLCQAAVKAHEDKGHDVWFNSPGKKLIVDGNGDVIGVVIEKEGVETKVKANGGVVLAMGGFENNQEMVSSYLQQPYVHQRGGLFNEGDGIKMATAVGADLWHMSNSAGFTWTYQNPEMNAVGLTGVSVALGCIVGLGGPRFMNESAENRHGRMEIGGRWISTPMPLPAYAVHDADQLATKFMASFSDNYVNELASGEIISGATLEELAENIRKSKDGKDAPDFSTEKFVASINDYNKRFDAGENADYGRPIATMKPIKTGPFYAVKIGPTYFNTMGGPRRNKDGSVVNVDGVPINGLFSAGELGSVFCDMYNGGGNLGETMVFGRISGKNAALRAQDQFTASSDKPTQWVGESNEIPPVEMVSGPYKDGTYEGFADGFIGPMVVSVTVSGDKIIDVALTEVSETATLGGNALVSYVMQITDTQNFEDMDVVSTATNTMYGFQRAVNDALKKAK